MNSKFPLLVRPGLALAICCAGLLAPGLCAATEWSAKPSVSVNLQHDSNLLLTTASHQGVTALTVAPRIDLSAQQENWNVSGSAELRGHRYWGESGLNGNDQIFNLSSLYRTQRSTWQLGGGYAKESVTASTAFSPDIGLVGTQTQRITRSVNPSWLFQMTQRTQIELSYQSSLVSYQNGPNTYLSDYDASDGAAALLYQWSPRDQLSAEVDRSYFKVPQSGLSQLGQPAFSPLSGGLFILQPNPQQLSNTSNTDNLVLGWTHAFSQTLNGNIGFGARQTTSDSVVQTCTSGTPTSIIIIGGQPVGIGPCTQTADTVFSEKSSGYLYNAGLTKQFTLTHVALSLSRQVNPSAIGSQVLTDSATLAINHTLSQRLSAGLSLSSYRIQAISSTTPGTVKWNYILASTDLIWHWTRQLKVQGGYRYLRVGFPNSSLQASDNAIYLNLSYAWQGASISR